MIRPSVSCLVPQPWRRELVERRDARAEREVGPVGREHLQLRELDARDECRRRARRAGGRAWSRRGARSARPARRRRSSRRRFSGGGGRWIHFAAPQSDASSRPISNVDGALHAEASPSPSQARTCHETCVARGERRAGVGRLRDGAGRPGRSPTGRCRRRRRRAPRRPSAARRRRCRRASSSGRGGVVDTERLVVAVVDAQSADGHRGGVRGHCGVTRRHSTGPAMVAAAGLRQAIAAMLPTRRRGS